MKFLREISFITAIKSFSAVNAYNRPLPLLFLKL